MIENTIWILPYLLVLFAVSVSIWITFLLVGGKKRKKLLDKKIANIEKQVVRITEKLGIVFTRQPDRSANSLLDHKLENLEKKLSEIIGNLENRSSHNARHNYSSILKSVGSEDQSDLSIAKIENKEIYTRESVNVESNYPRITFSDPETDITNQYNAASENRSKRNAFREKYEMIRFGNDKADEQRLGEASEPEFRELDNGNFLGITDSSGGFFVLPRFDTTLDSVAFNEGGIGFAFDCANYDPNKVYTDLRVEIPAKFRRNGQVWSLVEKGKLDLGS